MNSLITIFTKKSPQLDAFQFDAVFEDNLEFEVEFPDYPIETGARVTDHRVIKPFRYSLVGGVSNNPIRPVVTDLIGGGLSNLLSSSSVVGMAAGISAGFLSGSESTRASSALEQLIKMAADAKPFYLDAVDVQLENMVITRLRRARDPENENSLIFIAELGELITIDRLNVRLGNDPANMADGDPAQTAAAGTANRGQEGGVNPSEATTFAVQEVRDIQGTPL